MPGTSGRPEVSWGRMHERNVRLARLSIHCRPAPCEKPAGGVSPLVAAGQAILPAMAASGLTQ